MSETKHTVRTATPADIESLRLVVPAIIAENTILPPSEGRIAAVIERCVHRVSGSIAGVIDGGEQGIAATVGLCFTQSYASEMPFVQAVWCGLAPAVRKVDKAVAVDDPRRHYGKQLFDFTKWFHATMERMAAHPVLIVFDVLTTEGMGPKMGLYARNLTQVGGSFALGAKGSYAPQAWVRQEMVA